MAKDNKNKKAVEATKQDKKAAAKKAPAKKEAQVINKGDFSAKVSETSGVDAKTVELVLTHALDAITNYVADGDKVAFVGFGNFEPSARSARKGRNPQTGAQIDIAASVIPSFKAGKSFKDRVKAGDVQWKEAPKAKSPKVSDVEVAETTSTKAATKSDKKSKKDKKKDKKKGKK